MFASQTGANPRNSKVKETKGRGAAEADYSSKQKSVLNSSVLRSSGERRRVTEDTEIPRHFLKNKEQNQHTLFGELRID